MKTNYLAYCKSTNFSITDSHNLLRHICFYITLFLLLFLFALFCTSCSDSSSSTNAPAQQQVNAQTDSLASQEILPSANDSINLPTNPNVTEPDSSATKLNTQNTPTDSSVQNITNQDSLTNISANSFNTNPATINLSVTPDADGFYDIGNVYKALPTTSNVTFVLRHAERESGLGQESPLTEVGLEQALAAGKKISSDETFYYASTDFVRTRTTAAKIAEGHGEPNATVETLDIINGSYFLTVPSDTLDALIKNRGGSWKNISQFLYGATVTNSYVAARIGAYFYDLFERGDQFINEVVKANLPNWKRVNILISHDVLLEPLLIYATNKTIDLKFYESGRWVNYLSGVAVIVDSNNLVTLLPVRGTDVGYMTVKNTEN